MITKFSANWFFLGLMALAFTSMVATPLRADSLKSYTATITPSSFEQGDNHWPGPFTLTITNVDSTPGANKIGSARSVVPAGFTAPTLGTLSVSANKCWSASLVSGVIELEAIDCPGGGPQSGEGRQKLALNEFVSIQVSAVYCPGVYTWTTDASSQPNFTWTFGSGDWTVSGSDPILTVTGHCSGGFFDPGDYCTFTQGGWGQDAANGNNVRSLLDAYFFSLVYSGLNYVQVGGDAQDDNSPYGMRFTSPGAVADYLPAGKTPAALTEDHVDPTSTESGNFGGQVLTLRLNVDFSEKNIPSTPKGPLGDLSLTGFSNALDGQTIANILAAAEVTLGGGLLPSPITTISELNDLIDNINNAFDGCTVVSDWAIEHLTE